MQEKTEWELVDEPMRQSDSRWQSQDQTQRNMQNASGMKHILQAMLGPWWRWKLVGGGIVAALVLVTFAMLTGVAALLAAACAALAIGIGKVRQWTRRHGGALTP